MNDRDAGILYCDATNGIRLVDIKTAVGAFFCLDFSRCRMRFKQTLIHVRKTKKKSTGNALNAL